MSSIHVPDQSQQLGELEVKECRNIGAVGPLQPQPTDYRVERLAECPVCRERCIKPIELNNCGHSLCRKCTIRCFRQTIANGDSPSCPYCCDPVVSIVPNRFAEDLLQNPEVSPDEESDAEKTLIQEMQRELQRRRQPFVWLEQALKRLQQGDLHELDTMFATIRGIEDYISEVCKKNCEVKNKCISLV